MSMYFLNNCSGLKTISFILILAISACNTQNSDVLPDSDTVIYVDNLPSPDGDYMREYERILIDQYGLAVMNMSGDKIGCSKGLQGPWRPVTNYRETLKGTLKEYRVDVYHPDQDEYDWILVMEPSPSHVDFFGDDEIECEVTPSDAFRDNIWFPLKGSGKPSLLLNYELCLYGPYVIDEYNDGKEIHPIDAIWWQRKVPQNNQIRVMLLQDAAKMRFREPDMFIMQDCDANFDNWQPWIQYPHAMEMKIPFSYVISKNKYTEVKIDVIEGQQIATADQIQWREADNGEIHQLLLGNAIQQLADTPRKIALKVVEKKGLADDQITVQFVNITYEDNETIRGYIRLIAALGFSIEENEGVMVVNLTFTEKLNQNQQMPVLEN